MTFVEDPNEAPTVTAPASNEDDGWEWGLVEIMGFRKHYGRIREIEKFGAKMLRVDVPTVIRKPNPDSTPEKPLAPLFEVTAWQTHLYGGSSIFGVTPSDETSVLMHASRDIEAPHRLTYRDPADYDDGEGDE